MKQCTGKRRKIGWQLGHWGSQMSSRPERSLCHQVWGHRQEYHPDLRQGLDRLGCILLDSCTGEYIHNVGATTSTSKTLISCCQLFRPAPPPLRPGVAPPGVRLPPGPPPGRPPTGLPPGVSGGGRLPPGPPPGVPPRINRLPPPVRPQSVVSAGPQLFTQVVSPTLFIIIRYLYRL